MEANINMQYNIKYTLQLYLKCVAQGKHKTMKSVKIKTCFYFLFYGNNCIYCNKNLCKLHFFPC